MQIMDYLTKTLVSFRDLIRETNTRFSTWQLITIYGTTAIVIWRSSRFLLWKRRQARLKKSIKNYQTERTVNIKALSDRLSSVDKELLEKRKSIVSQPISSLIASLQNETLKPIEVLEAFQWSALQAHQHTNCIALFITEAEKWAKDLEAQYTGRPKPALYGLPISLKEHIGVKGYVATGGYAKRLGTPQQNDALIVRQLKALGTVPFVLTNVPQTLHHFHCSNPIYGRTNSPYRPDRSSGGSSGGEGALQACRGAAFGIGSDVGGSIRMPAHYSGCVGLKPTTQRLTLFDCPKFNAGRAVIGAVLGPMASDVDTLVTVMEALLTDDHFSQDFSLVPVPFRRHLYETDQKLTIGYFETDKCCDSTASNRRAVRQAKEILEKAGHRLVPFTPPDTEHAYNIFVGALFFDGGAYINNEMQADVVDDLQRFSAFIFSLPTSVRRLFTKLAYYIGVGNGIDPFPSNLKELTRIFSEVGAYKIRFMSEWKSLKLDALICPPHPCPSLPHEQIPMALQAVCYCSLYNMLDYPAGVVPLTRVTDDDQKETAKLPVTSGIFKLVRDSSLDKTVGLPVGVQVVTPSYTEERCLRLMKQLQDAL